jgi:oleate hydratase
LPITEYLIKVGVDFRFSEKVIDIDAAHDKEITTISNIKYQTADGTESVISLLPADLVFVTLGSVGAMPIFGTNKTAPGHPSGKLPEGDWSLWQKLAEKDPKFGNPGRFLNHTLGSTIEKFTVTLKNQKIFDRILALTHDDSGPQLVLSLTESNWLLTIDVPQQPVISEQPYDVFVFYGWAMYPERIGNFVKKPMLNCSGEEILEELLLHLQFPLMPTVSEAITIPCVTPLATAPLLPRRHGDRPAVVPSKTENLGLLGQFIELPEEATSSMEYSVRGAQMAVNQLMCLPQKIPEPKRNYVVEFLDLLS